MSSPVWNRSQDLVVRTPVYVGADEKLRAVAHKLWAEEIGVALVTDDAKVVGIVSERDVVAALARDGSDLDTVVAADVMHRDVISLRPEDSIYDAASQMLDCGIRHLPLIDRFGTLTGVISLRDLVRPLLVESLGG